MTTYTIAAIPTVYNGRQYRSRLEAKWAAFFDRLGWEFEYEPFDLGSWSPDFLIRGDDGDSLLVEIKPINTFDQAVGDKIIAALQERDMLWNTRPAVFGVCPERVTVHGYRRAVRLGWKYDYRIGEKVPPAWLDAVVGWSLVGERPQASVDLWVQRHTERWANSLHVMSSVLTGSNRAFYPDHAMSLWAEATNAVQWRGEQAQP